MMNPAPTGTDPPSTNGPEASKPEPGPATPTLNGSTTSTPKGYSLRLKVSQKILILGDYETGKTTLAKRVMAAMPRFMAWDPRQDVFTGGKRDFKAFQDEFAKTGRAIYVPGRGQLEQKMDAFLEFALKQHDAMVFIDEPSMLGGSRALPQSFHDLHRLGHARGLGVTIATHTIWDLPHVTHQAHHLFVFRIDRAVELNTLGQVLSRAGVEWVQRAPKFHFWHKGSDGHEGAMNPLPRETKGLQPAGTQTERKEAP